MASETKSTLKQEAYHALQTKFEALKAELPCISFGYLGNYERWGDDTQWYIFLPHFGRVGTYTDQISIGPGRDENTFSKALENWDKIATSARKMYHAKNDRIASVQLRNGLICDLSGQPIGLGINPPPKFASEELASNYLRHYNVPAVLIGHRL
jgi:hypothetical protein